MGTIINFALKMVAAYSRGEFILLLNQWMIEEE